MAAQVGACEVDTHGQAQHKTRQDAGPADDKTNGQEAQSAGAHWLTDLPADYKAVTDTNGQASKPGADTHTGQETQPEVSNESEGDVADALEEALERLGPFGTYQQYMLVMLCVPNVLAAMYSLNYVFVADLVPFRCVVPECEGSSPPFENEPAQALLPAASCQRYSPSYNTSLGGCDRDSFLNTTIDCDLFVYENLDTTFAEFDLACREWLRTLVGTVRNSALPVALILTGYISDTFGRRTAFCLFSTCMALMGIVKSLSVNYQMYLTFEFLEAALGYGFTSAAYVMMIELARPSLRAAFACATGVAFGAGGVLFAWLAWRVRYWRHLLLAIHSLALLLPLYWLLVDESVRWLHVSGRRDRSVAIIRKAARWNKVVLDDEVMKKLESEESIAKPPPTAWLGVARSRALWGRLALVSWCWVAVAFVYYGLTINSVALAGDKYVNFALNMAMEIVASLLIMMALERFGRKRSIFCAFLLCGVSCVIPFFVSHQGTGLGMFFVGKLSIAFAFNSIYVFTAELFPTRVRSSALAACSLVGRLGAILAPQTPLLSAYVQALLYGVCSLSAACVVLLVPETRRTRLPADVSATERVRPASAAPPPRRAPAPAPRVLSADT